MLLDLNLHIIGRLLLAAVLGGIVGLERELRRKPAGLRTNLFMCVGAALFTLLSDEAARRFGGDHVRIAAQIIPGIGFIGAGAVIRERGGVIGLTTAATIFVVASIGMAVGAGLYLTAAFSTLLVLSALTLLGWMEGRFGLKTRLVTIRLTTTDAEKVMTRAHDILQEMKITMQHFQIHHVGSEFVMEFDAEVGYAQQHLICQRLSSLEASCEVVPLEAARE